MILIGPFQLGIFCDLWTIFTLEDFTEQYQQKLLQDAFSSCTSHTETKTLSSSVSEQKRRWVLLFWYAGGQKRKKEEREITKGMREKQRCTSCWTHTDSYFPQLCSDGIRSQELPSILAYFICLSQCSCPHELLCSSKRGLRLQVLKAKTRCPPCFVHFFLDTNSHVVI